MPLTEMNSRRDSQVSQPPLCVDLDGTLIATDLLFESVLVLLKQNFWYLFLLPIWLLKGKAYLKEQVARRVDLKAEWLPYRAGVLDFLRQEKESGRSVILATASHMRYARAIADHLDLFDEVIATENNCNLKGDGKLKSLQERFGSSGFAYIGDSAADLPVWQEARQAYLVQPSRRLLMRAKSCCPAAGVLEARPSKLGAAIKLLRPHQWAKNLLLFVPLVLAHQVSNWPALILVIFAFAAFCLCASSVYIVNDLLDLESDRRHPQKRRRPLASGTLSIAQGIGLCIMTLVSGLALALLVHPMPFWAILILYLVATTVYSLFLKYQPIFDVFTLAGLYTLRILAGGLAAQVKVTGWMIAFSIFFFISLAFVKRYSELLRETLDEAFRTNHRGYRMEDMRLIQSVGPSTGYMAVLTMCMYINTTDVLKLYSTPHLLWIICLVLFVWMTRMWFLSCRQELNEDPVVFAITDPFSYLAGLIAIGVLFFAA